MKLAERSLLGARQVQDSSGEMCSGPPVTGGSSLPDTFRGVRFLRIFKSSAWTQVLTSRLLGSSI